MVEFVLILPILIALAFGAGSVAMGAHQGEVAALAVAQIATHKMEMATQDGASSVNAYATGGPFKGPFSKGSTVDSVSVTVVDPYTDLAVGVKNFTPYTSMIPGFSMKAGAVINHSLQQPMSTGAVAHPTGPWVPGGTPMTPPWP